MEEKQEEKIGFGNYQPDEKSIERQNLAKLEREKYKAGNGLRIPARLLCIFGAIASTITMMYYLLPIFSAFIGALIAVFLIFFMIFSVIITIGLILMNDGYRNWIGNHMFDVPNWFFNIAKHITELSKYFLITAIPALVFCLAGLILAIVGVSEKHKKFVGILVVSAIFFVNALFFTILYAIAGGQTMTFN